MTISRDYLLFGLIILGLKDLWREVIKVVKE